MDKVERCLKVRKDECLLRSLRPADLRKDGYIYFNGKKYIDLSSNDYLGLSGHPCLKEASKRAVEEFGVSASASRLLSGDLTIFHQLQEGVASFKQKEAALVFNSGYQLNVGVIGALCQRGDVIFSDRLNHASIIDGILLSGAKLFRFDHNDMEDLERLLKKERCNYKTAMIVTETVFSMDGDKAPLNELVRLKREYNCTIMVDEAHATGLFGEGGSGVVEEEGLADEIDIIMGTFSKALGSFGGYLASSKKITDFLINYCRSFIYSTALPPSVVAASLASMELVKSEPIRRTQLLKLAEYFRLKLQGLAFKTIGVSQIVPLLIGESQKALDMSCFLQDRGYWVLPIRPPTVPQGTARLRFSLTYYHNKDILDRLIDDIESIR